MGPTLDGAVRIEAFGDLRIVGDAGVVSAWDAAPEARPLLALLAVRAGTGVPRAWAEELLAGGTVARDWWARGTESLRTLLGSRAVVASEEHLTVAEAGTTSDVIEFRSAIAGGDLERAVALHRARLADGMHFREHPRLDRWLSLQRETFESEAASALERLARDAEERDEPLQAVRWWRQLAVQYPLNERIAASLMEALLRAGDREGAMRHARFVEALARERLDRPEDDDVLALASALRDAAAGAAGPADDPIATLRRALRSRYRLEDELGRGGHGLVMRARDLRHDRAVAIKVLHPDLAPAMAGARFAREIRLVAQLQHPNILPLFDSGTAAGIAYYVMPLVAGGSLGARLEATPCLATEAVLRIGTQVAGALAAAHGHGIVHRDVKPENILLSGGDALLADFGIACVQHARQPDPPGASLTVPGLAVGTPAYMSPEQAVPDAVVDGRADQYSLACVLWRLLTGAGPFAGRGPGAVLAAHASAPVPSLRERRPDLPPAFDALFARALAKVPEERFPDMAAFAAALDEARLCLRIGRGRHAPSSPALGPPPGVELP